MTHGQKNIKPVLRIRSLVPVIGILIILSYRTLPKAKALLSFQKTKMMKDKIKVTNVRQ